MRGGRLLAAVVLVLIVKVVTGAQPAISKFGLGFISHTDWAPKFGVRGGDGDSYGTLVTSAIALVIGAPLAISIGALPRACWPRPGSAT